MGIFIKFAIEFVYGGRECVSLMKKSLSDGHIYVYYATKIFLQ